jgi:dTDP-3-amino-3,4,6-trideoxy-alpha-D-glucose transaminase
MRVAFLDTSRQVSELRQELQGAVAGVLEGGRFVLGPAVERFEAEFARFCGVPHAVGVASGTDALTIALRAVGVGPGDEVVTAANTCVPTVAGIEASGAAAVLCDVDDSFTLDPARLEEAITPRTRAIVPVHLYGQCADMDAVQAIAERHGLKIVEDAAQAHGAEHGRRRAGALGDAAAFSFYPTKNLGAVGDGGAVVTADPRVAERARRLRAYGERERNLSVERGMNSRLDELQAAILLAKLRHLDAANDARRAIARRYLDELAGYPVALPAERPGSRHVFHLFVVRAASRDRFRTVLSERGVETLVHYPRPVHRHPAYAGLAQNDSLTRAERFCDEVVSLPLYPELRDDEIFAVAAAVRDVLSESEG